MDSPWFDMAQDGGRDVVYLDSGNVLPAFVKLKRGDPDTEVREDGDRAAFRNSMKTLLARGC